MCLYRCLSREREREVVFIGIPVYVWCIVGMNYYFFASTVVTSHLKERFVREIVYVKTLSSSSPDCHIALYSHLGPPLPSLLVCYLSFCHIQAHTHTHVECLQSNGVHAHAGVPSHIHTPMT